MNYNAQKEQINTAVVPLLLEPVPIFYREEVRWGRHWEGGDAVYIARLMLNIDDEYIIADFAKAPQKESILSKANTAKLYPNPAQNEVIVEFDNALTLNAFMEIYGYTGKILQTNVLKQGNKYISVSTKELKSGIYFYRVIINNEVIANNKLVIIK